MGEQPDGPAYVDFLAFALIHLLPIVPVLNIARSHQLLLVTYMQPAGWQASTLLAAFQSFFTLVLLQQIFASIVPHGGPSRFSTFAN